MSEWWSGTALLGVVFLLAIALYGLATAVRGATIPAVRATPRR
jgi:hypothetical protein